MNKNNPQLNIKEGTISFWVNEGKVDWGGNDTVPLFEASEQGNSIFIVKDDDKKLKCFHVNFGKGRTDVEADVSDLDPEERHFIVLTWNVEDGELKLYVDGKLRSKSTIDYSKNLEK